MNRDFKGIWIPREIWLRKDLSALEKSLWAEIHSLFDREKGGCYASNEYLAEFCGVKDRRLRDMIYHLRDLGLIQEVSFNGRERIIKAVLPPETYDPCQADWQNNANPGGRKVPVSMAEKCQPLIIYRDTSLDKSIEHTTQGAAKAADVVISSSSSSIPPDKPPPLSDEAEKLEKEIISLMKTVNPNWNTSKTHRFAHHCDKILKLGYTYQDIIKIVLWALKSEIWSGMLFKKKKSPGLVLCEYVDDWFVRMKNSKKQKTETPEYEPGSDKDRALKLLKEQRKNAI